MTLQRWLTVEEAAIYCGVASRTIRSWAASGRLRHGRTLRGSYRLRTADLDELLRACAEVEPTGIVGDASFCQRLPCDCEHGGPHGIGSRKEDTPRGRISQEERGLVHSGRDTGRQQLPVSREDVAQDHERVGGGRSAGEAPRGTRIGQGDRNTGPDIDTDRAGGFGRSAAHYRRRLRRAMAAEEASGLAPEDQGRQHGSAGEQSAPGARPHRRR